MRKTTKFEEDAPTDRREIIEGLLNRNLHNISDNLRAITELEIQERFLQGRVISDASHKHEIEMQLGKVQAERRRQEELLKLTRDYVEFLRREFELEK